MVMARKTLLHLTPLAVIGGCEINCLRVVEGLGDHDHRILVFDDPGPMSARWEAAGARVDHLRAWRHGRRKFRAALAAWAEQESGPAGVLCWSTSRLPAVIGVLRGWDAPWGVHLGNPIAGGLGPNLRRWLQEHLNPALPAVTLVACSNHVADSHRRAFYFRRFPTEVIYNAVDPSFDRTREHRELPPGSRPRVGMVARLDAIKDHATVIRALAAIAHVRADVIVEFAGDGALRQNLEQEAHRLGVADRIRFLGFIPVGPLLAEWDVYLHSTTAAEGMGTAVAEAMTAGLPCLVSDLPMMREVCGDAGAVYIRAADAVGLGQALLHLIGNRGRREELGRAAQDRARHLFTLPRVAGSYLRVVTARTGDNAT